MDKKLDDNLPIYMQIMSRIRESVVAGKLQPGDRVPSVRELAGHFEVNPNTMQRALTELEREGLLVSERTVGRFVTRDEALILGLKRKAAEDAADAFRREMQALGFTDEEAMDFFRKRCEVIQGSTGKAKMIG